MLLCIRVHIRVTRKWEWGDETVPNQEQEISISIIIIIVIITNVIHATHTLQNT
jgi:hypothetical protein